MTDLPRIRAAAASLAAAACFVAASLVAGAAAASPNAPVAAVQPVLVELFTSQGCSACPPADALLNELADREDVLALSYNITYWDYLGWRDTLGREEHTARQEAYANRFEHRKYTPQVVIDGRSHMPGSRTDAVMDAIGERLRRDDVPAGDDANTVAAIANGSGYHLEAAARGEGSATIWLVHFDRRHEVEITRGENAGETFVYANVVRDIEPIATWDMSRPLDADIPADVIRAGGHDGCAVIVQTGLMGPVIAVARLDMAALN